MPSERDTVSLANTLVSAPDPASQPAQVAPDLPDLGGLEATGFAGRYDAGALIGEGGMGQVRLYRDRRIGREVALKVARRQPGQGPDLSARFLREARVQGQLEHPAIVPVYDLGLTPAGEPFFTMKRVRGTSLHEILYELRHDHGRPGYSRRKLLSAFSSVCLAIDFAHERGVLHRDLKPANIMLGDYGEVYVLDWGLARLLDAPDPLAVDTARLQVPVDGARTQAGQVLGTPGYMAPEQLRGAPLDARTDVYALGALLYEVLTGQPMHPGDDMDAIVRSTLSGAPAQAPLPPGDEEVAPELDAIWRKATALRPQDRYPSARALQEAIEAYLDGDRDLARRRELAAAHAEHAAAAAARALGGGSDEASQRRLAMQEVGRALGLDPQHAGALGVLVRLMTEPPRTLPADVEAAIARERAGAYRFAAYASGIAYLAWLAMVPLCLWMGVRQVVPFALVWGFVGMAGVLGVGGARAGRAGPTLLFLVLLMSCGGVLMGTQFFGPFILMPAVAVMTALAFTTLPDRRLRGLAVIMNCLALAVPALLQQLGALPPAYRFQDGALVVVPQMLAYPPRPTWIFLFLNSLAPCITSALFFFGLRDALSRAEQRILLQSWQLRQLVPEAAPPPSRPG